MMEISSSLIPPSALQNVLRISRGGAAVATAAAASVASEATTALRGGIANDSAMAQQEELLGIAMSPEAKAVVLVSCVLCVGWS